MAGFNTVEASDEISRLNNAVFVHVPTGVKVLALRSQPGVSLLLRSPLCYPGVVLNTGYHGTVNKSRHTHL